MPEGDTIYRTARTLRAALGGQVVAAVAARAPRLRTVRLDRLVGQTVGAVESRGKHLLLWFSPHDVALHSHMGMTGSWHLYRPSDRWRKPERLATLRLDVGDWTAVCFSAPVCELLSRAQVAAHPALAALGPDALAPDTDLTEARRRLDGRSDMAIADALLDQRVLAGVGNVYRSEVLFLHGVDPSVPVRDVPGELRDALLETATRLLGQNVRPGVARRTTTGQGRGEALYVYGRARRPCRRCGAAIERSGVGRFARTVYWCPRCQQR